LSATKTQVVPFELHTAGAVNRSVAPGVSTVCSSPPRLPAGARRDGDSTRNLPSLPPCSTEPPASTGDVEPRSRSLVFSSSALVGVQLPVMCEMSGESRISESPQLVFPSNGALPVATYNAPVERSTTAPARPQIAESLAPQVLGWITWWRSEHS